MDSISLTRSMVNIPECKIASIFHGVARSNTEVCFIQSIETLPLFFYLWVMRNDSKYRKSICLNSFYKLRKSIFEKSKPSSLSMSSKCNKAIWKSLKCFSYVVSNRWSCTSNTLPISSYTYNCRPFKAFCKFSSNKSHNTMMNLSRLKNYGVHEWINRFQSYLDKMFSTPLSFRVKCFYFFQKTVYMNFWTYKALFKAVSALAIRPAALMRGQIWNQ